MLVLSRRIGEEIVIPQLGIAFTILEVCRDKVRVGVSAPGEVQVHRREVWERIRRIQSAPAGNAGKLVEDNALGQEMSASNGVRPPL